MGEQNVLCCSLKAEGWVGTFRQVSACSASGLVHLACGRQTWIALCVLTKLGSTGLRSQPPVSL